MTKEIGISYRQLALCYADVSGDGLIDAVDASLVLVAINYYPNNEVQVSTHYSELETYFPDAYNIDQIVDNDWNDYLNVTDAANILQYNAELAAGNPSPSVAHLGHKIYHL